MRMKDPWESGHGEEEHFWFRRWKEVFPRPQVLLCGASPGSRELSLPPEPGTTE